MTREALFYQSLPGLSVRCRLCAHHCLLSEGRRGFCGVRENRSGRLYTLVYRRAAAVNVDPVEKKPLYHFLPGSRSLSIGTAGCNFRCLFCQNSDLSQGVKKGGIPVGTDLPPRAAVLLATGRRCLSISFTYSEPTVFFEYALETAEAACEAGLRNVFVTNGYLEKSPLERIAPFLHAANVDLKSFRDDFYQRLCGAKLRPVLSSLALMKELGAWVEVTTLLVPGENDSPSEIRAIARFICRELGAETPWHISRFFPSFRMAEHPAAPVESIITAREIGLAEGLLFVYPGNVNGAPGGNTDCPGCGARLITRRAHSVFENRLADGLCPDCRRQVPGVFDLQEQSS